MFKTVEVLSGDHRTFCRLLDLIEQEIEVFRRAEQPDYALLQAVLEYFEGYPHCAHLPTECVVYDKLRLRAPEVCGNIPDPDCEHHRHAECLTAFAQLLRRVLAEGEIPRETVIEAADSFILRMRRHVEMEEASFLPAALENLQAEDWREIEAHYVECRGSAPDADHYEALREEILNWSGERRDRALQEA